MDTTLLKELRSRTGLGLSECSRALTESGGDVEAAVRILLERGLLRAADLSSRAVGEGRIHSYVHSNPRVGAMVDVRCETDFASRSDDFVSFCEALAMHVVAASPKWLSVDPVNPSQDRTYDVPVEDLCLLSQRLITSPDRTVDQARADLSARLGENVVIKRFARFEVGE